ncbi:hypothetical protein KY311_00865, partial [Candidatus Woesearchaeota archaeon]|nr:hypothetical protein [Candidatus Woesearchaeota archaeon]
MNAKQFAYQYGRLRSKYDQQFFAASSAMLGTLGIMNFARAFDYQGEFDSLSMASGIVCAGCALMTAKEYLLIHKARKKKKALLGKIEDKSTFKNEHVEKVVIDHPEGLELLLDKTSRHSLREWGTCIDAHMEEDDSSRVIIDYILDPNEAIKQGLFGNGTRSSLRFSLAGAKARGYNGFHHYHTTIGPRWTGGRNFAVSEFDRTKEPNWINLLTFNMPEGPEIIAFNFLHTYIP